jgi:hypothetical protein
MNVQATDFGGRAQTGGGLSPNDIRELRRETWQGGVVGRVEADTLLLANDDLRGSSPEWSTFFIEALFEHVVNGTDPKGMVDSAVARWLWSRIGDSGTVSGIEELELLALILQKVDAVADILKQHALGVIEKAVSEGVGPTRAGKLIGREIPVGCISENELGYLRRMVFRTDRNHPRNVGRIEAEALFRIKQATDGGDNPKDWPYVFVQGVGTYLQQFGGNEPLTGEQEIELMSFMTADGANLADFLQKMFEAQAGNGVREHLRGEHDLDPLERALLEFLAA